MGWVNKYSQIRTTPKQGHRGMTVGTDRLWKCKEFQAVGWLSRSNQEDMEIWAWLGRREFELSGVTEGLEGKRFGTD